jgi:hypothetical protein
MAAPRPYKCAVSSLQLFDRFHRFAGFRCLAVAEFVFQRAVIRSLGTLISPGDQLAHGDRSFFALAAIRREGIFVQRDEICRKLRDTCDLFNTSRPSGYYMYHQFNFQQFYVPPTQCI